MITDLQAVEDRRTLLGFVWACVFLAAAAAAIIGQVTGVGWLTRGGLDVATPVLFFVFTDWSSRATPNRIGAGIGAALLLSWCGDVTDTMTIKIAAFAVAHVAYIVTLWRWRPSLVRYVALLAPAAVVAAVAVGWQTPGLLPVAVVVYALLAAATAWCASGLGRLGTIGGIAFLLSDLGVGYGAFRADHAPALFSAGVLAVYLAAQALIVLALSRETNDPS